MSNTTATDYRALCAELLDEVAARPLILDRELIARARAFLAEPVAEGPTDEEIDAWITECADATRHGPLDHYWALDVEFDYVRDITRAALGRWGNYPAQPDGSPAPPAEGEVAEGPTDEELLGLMPQQLRDDLATVSRMAAHGAGPDVTPGLFEASLTAGALQFVRAVLAAEAEGPAVPEGREPASVVGEPSDENCWQWYTYCPEEGIELYSSREQAQSAAQSIMGSYAVAAHSDGWHEDMELVSWGMLVPIEQAQAVERKTVELDDEFDEWVKYELKTPRWGHQPAPPAEGEVADLIAWLGDEADQYDCIQQAPETARRLRRAADLFAQRHPEPVPVAERLPGPEDCDAEGTCWVWHGTATTWGLFRLDPTVHSHWLPASVLPLPAVEVQP